MNESTVLKGRVNLIVYNNATRENETINVQAWVCGPLCIHHSPPLYKKGVYTLTLTAEGLVVVGKMRIARWKLEELMKLLVEMDGWYDESDVIAKNSELREAVLPLYKYQ
jgi:hypothetical protein